MQMTDKKLIELGFSFPKQEDADVYDDDLFEEDDLDLNDPVV